MTPTITRVALISASRAELELGLIGWVSFDLSGLLRVDGVALRRRLDGRPTLSFPCRKGKSGTSHAYLRPLDAPSRAIIERQVFAALGLNGSAP